MVEIAARIEFIAAIGVQRQSAAIRRVRQGEDITRLAGERSRKRFILAAADRDIRE